jgi:hypothetical protein
MPNIDYNINAIEPGNTLYAQHIARAFPFFRRHAEGRYSDSTMMRLANANDNAARFAIDPNANQWYEDDGSEPRRPSPRRRTRSGSTPLPMLIVAERPYSYDSDTEIKTGGILGMCATWREDGGRTILAVHRDHRRNEVGSRMLNLAMCTGPVISMWVGRTNTTAQQFLLAQRLYPTGMNANGVLRYSNVDTQEEE